MTEIDPMVQDFRRSVESASASADGIALKLTERLSMTSRPSREAFLDKFEEYHKAVIAFQVGREPREYVNEHRKALIDLACAPEATLQSRMIYEALHDYCRPWSVEHHSCPAGWLERDRENDRELQFVCTCECHRAAGDVSVLVNLSAPSQTEGLSELEKQRIYAQRPFVTGKGPTAL